MKNGESGMNSDLQAAFASVLAGLIGWFGLFAWDNEAGYDADGSVQSVYSPWQIALMAVLLIVLSAAFVWLKTSRRR